MVKMELLQEDPSEGLDSALASNTGVTRRGRTVSQIMWVIYFIYLFIYLFIYYFFFLNWCSLSFCHETGVLLSEAVAIAHCLEINCPKATLRLLNTDLTFFPPFFFNQVIYMVNILD